MEFTHFNSEGQAHMVDVSNKHETVRTASAEGWVELRPDVLELIKQGQMGKGDVLGVARVAGIMAAKQTAQFIPLCHALAITGVEIEFEFQQNPPALRIEAQVKTTGKTGVEMEALTAVSITALTVYDMCKAVDKGMTITGISLLKKTGGKSGVYERKEDVYVPHRDYYGE